MFVQKLIISVNQVVIEQLPGFLLITDYWSDYCRARSNTQVGSPLLRRAHQFELFCVSKHVSDHAFFAMIPLTQLLQQDELELVVAQAAMPVPGEPLLLQISRQLTCRLL
jgi:hypothetical protein